MHVIVDDGDTYIISSFDFADNHIIDISTTGYITSKSDSQIHISRMYMNLKSVTYMRSKSRVSFRDVGTIININS